MVEKSQHKSCKSTCKFRRQMLLKLQNIKQRI